MLDMTTPETVKLTLATPNDAVNFKLKADIVDELLEKSDRNRLPIIDSQGKVLYVLHRSFIDKFLVKQVEAGTTLTDITLQDLLSTQDLKSIFQSFATVGTVSRLNAVKQAMDGNPNCSDCFVTEDGSKATKARGWITDVIVREKAVA